MPCSDVTESLTIVLDREDRLVDYSLSKKTCGRAVGERELLVEWARNRTATELLDASIDSVQAAHPTDSDEEEFLVLKHFFALRSGLRVLLGMDPGSAGAPCAAEAIAYTENGSVEFSGQLRVEIITEEIKSCGKCSGCGSKKLQKLAAASAPAGQ